ncbi:hypothetical protein AFV7_gp30 [Betalipothrixvirus pezzuloense]|uniref:Uncharacterized protein n=1 Tax=Betalipothrixvirus pezzuloense TaxID=346883 RepID=A7WKP8_9VIRU|nr:hypothetical protein AFV7_gp30 [Acidianus filamentous virus 7]CAJ31650.1 conserved hypothetical protein [Acidianus filamentous virus 7]
MTIKKTTFIRLCFWTLSQARMSGIKTTPKIMLYFLDEVKVSPRTKERLLLLIDELDTGKITPREFARRLFLEYPPPTRKGRVLSLKEFKRITSLGK